MPRAIAVSNGQLYFNLDGGYEIRDVTYPHVGQRDHTKGNAWRFGVWVDGHLAWSSGEKFGRSINYLPDTLVSDVVLINEHELGVSLRCNDLVHHRHPIYMRKIEVENLRATPREVRLFFHHNPYISESADGNTVVFAPANRSLVAYKDDIVFMANAMVGDESGFHSYACGKKGLQGNGVNLDGCWRDAEDGKLEQAAVAQGSVDSIGSVHFRLEAGAKKIVYYWVGFGGNWSDCETLDRFVADCGPENLVAETIRYWRHWVGHKKALYPIRGTSEFPFYYNQDDRDITLSPEAQSLFRRSALILKANWDRQGACIAAVDNDIRRFGNDNYSYFWPRDGAFCAMALDAIGTSESTRAMFRLAARLIRSVPSATPTSLIGEQGYLLQKYNPSGSLASSWHAMVGPMGEPILPIQEDETALMVVALWNHCRLNNSTEYLFEGESDLYKRFVVPAANFLANFRDSATGLPKMSYDLWEERHGVMAFTVATVYAGLKAAAELGQGLGDRQAAVWKTASEEIKAAVEKHMFSQSLSRFVRMVTLLPGGEVKQDTELDSSMFALWFFGMFDADDPRIVATMQAIERRLWVKTSVGGLARYENDHYHSVTSDTANVPGNPWIITTLWLAQWYIRRAKNLFDLNRAAELIEWATEKASSAGILAEQLNPFTGEDLSVSPLTWSHATFILAAQEFAAKCEEFA